MIRKKTIVSGSTRVVFEEGYKGEGDEDIKVFLRDQNGADAIAITFHTIAVIVRELYSNEDYLYPPENGLEGGEKLLRAIREYVEAEEVDDAAWRKRFKLKER